MEDSDTLPSDTQPVKDAILKVDQEIEILKKHVGMLGVAEHLLFQIQLSELSLSNFPIDANLKLLDLNVVEDSQLNFLPLDSMDKHLIDFAKLHFLTWWNILNFSQDTRVNDIIEVVLPSLNFSSKEIFARSMTLLICYLSRMVMLAPVSRDIFPNEDSIVEAISAWDIDDPLVINAARAFYRIRRL